MYLHTCVGYTATICSMYYILRSMYYTPHAKMQNRSRARYDGVLSRSEGQKDKRLDGDTEYFVPGGMRTAT